MRCVGVLAAVQRCGRTRAFCRQPPVYVERVCKLATAAVLYAVTFGLLIAAFTDVWEPNPEYSLDATKPLIFSLSGCDVGVHTVPGSSGVRIVNLSQRGGITFLSINRQPGAGITVLPCEDATRVVCNNGNSDSSGRLAAMEVQIGADVDPSVLNVTLFASDSRRSSFTARDVTLKHVLVDAANAVVMFQNTVMESLTATLKFGLLDVRHSVFQTLTASVDEASVGVVHDSPVNLYMAGTDPAANLCLSSLDAVPSAASVSPVAVGDTGAVSSPATVTVTRSADVTTMGTVFVTASNTPGTLALRTASTSVSTLSTANDAVVVEAAFATTAAAVMANDFDVFRANVVGAGLSDGAVDGQFGWLWTRRDALLWFPLPAAQSLSLRAFKAPVFRAQFALTSSPCISEVVDVVKFSECPADGQDNATQVLLQSEAGAVFAALKAELEAASASFFNESGRLTSVRSTTAESHSFMTILSDDYALSKHGLQTFVSNGVGGAVERQFTTVWFMLCR